jgi:hypothetical protein
MITDKNGVTIKPGSTVQFPFTGMFPPQQTFFAALIADHASPIKAFVLHAHEGDKHNGKDPSGRGAVQDKYLEVTGHLPAAIEVELTLGKQVFHFPVDPAVAEVKGS